MLICTRCLVTNEEQPRPKYCEKVRGGDPDGKNQHDWSNTESSEGRAAMARREGQGVVDRMRAGMAQMRAREEQTGEEQVEGVEFGGEQTVTMRFPSTEGIPELPHLTGHAIGELPADILGFVQVLREWAAHQGDKAQCSLFCAFFPLVAEIDARERARSTPWYNPMGVDDVDVVRARLTLIQIRDSLLMPVKGIWDPEKVVLLSETIKLLHDLLSESVVTGLDTDGVGQETG